MDKEQIEVSDDNIFLQELIGKHSLSPKQIAGWIGRGVSTVYKYLSGELTIPSVVWRSIFDHTLDPTVFTIIRGDIPCVIAPTISIKPAADAATIKHLIGMRRAQLQCEKYILDILADNAIDKSDVTAISNYKLAFQDSIAAQIQLHRAITDKFLEAANAK